VIISSVGICIKNTIEFRQENNYNETNC